MDESTTPVSFRGLHIPITLEQACDPARTALIVYDVQAGIISQIKNKEQIVSGVLQVLDAARSAGIRVFFSRHLSLPKQLMGISQLRMAMEWQKTNDVEKISPWFLRDSPAFELIPELSPRTDEVIFDKITMSAFEGTFLNIAFRDAGIISYVIVGAATEVGIEPTIRHGWDLGLLPIIVTDACGTGHEQAAERSLASLAFAGNGFQTNIEAVCSIFKAGSSV